MSIYWRLTEKQRKGLDEIESESEKERILQYYAIELFTSSKAKKLAEEISRFVNGVEGTDFEWFIQQMGNEHRTLQQSFTGLCLKWLKHLADLPDDRFDLRNEASVNLAREIFDKVSLAQYGLPLI